MKSAHNIQVCMEYAYKCFQGTSEAGHIEQVPHFALVSIYDKLQMFLPMVLTNHISWTKKATPIH